MTRNRGYMQTNLWSKSVLTKEMPWQGLRKSFIRSTEYSNRRAKRKWFCLTVWPRASSHTFGSAVQFPHRGKKERKRCSFHESLFWLSTKRIASRDPCGQWRYNHSVWTAALTAEDSRVLTDPGLCLSCSGTVTESQFVSHGSAGNSCGSGAEGVPLC